LRITLKLQFQPKQKLLTFCCYSFIAFFWTFIYTNKSIHTLQTWHRSAETCSCHVICVCSLRIGLVS